jgi:hypothetical protein
MEVDASTDGNICVVDIIMKAMKHMNVSHSML